MPGAHTPTLDALCACVGRSYDDENQQTRDPPDAAVAAVRSTAQLLYCALAEAGIKAGDRVLLMPSGRWVHANGPLRGGVAHLHELLTEHGAHVLLASDIPYPSRVDAGYAYTQTLTRDMAHMLGVVGVVWHERAIEATRAIRSAAGRATMAGAFAHSIQSAGGRAGGRATMAGPFAHAIHSAGGRASGSGGRNGGRPKGPPSARQSEDAARYKAKKARQAAMKSQPKITFG